MKKLLASLVGLTMLSVAFAAAEEVEKVVVEEISADGSEEVEVIEVERQAGPRRRHRRMKRELPPLSDWTFFQLGFVPGYPTGTRYSNVYGLKLGAPMTSGYSRVYGVEPSILYSGTDHIMGVQASWFGPCVGRDIIGVQAGPSCAVAKNVYGFQAGAASVTHNIDGVQAGIVNVAKTVAGAQFAAVNVASEKVEGLQFGVVNYSRGGACQLGFINIIEDGDLPFMLIFNISLDDDDK